MNRALTCVHCGTLVAVETRDDVMRLRAHLVRLHTEIVALEALSQWAELIEHYRFVPLQDAILPRVVQLR
jgi:hypothetical protein